MRLNSVGCPNCRPIHRKALQEFLKPHFEELCPSCQSRFEKNPLRILDCKSPVCQKIVENAPTTIDCPVSYTHLVGITRSVIVNALRKLESAGVVEARSLGMKGTYIRILNDYLLEELEKIQANRHKF